VADRSGNSFKVTFVKPLSPTKMSSTLTNVKKAQSAADLTNMKLKVEAGKGGEQDTSRLAQQLQRSGLKLDPNSVYEAMAGSALRRTKSLVEFRSSGSDADAESVKTFPSFHQSECDHCGSEHGSTVGVGLLMPARVRVWDVGQPDSRGRHRSLYLTPDRFRSTFKNGDGIPVSGNSASGNTTTSAAPAPSRNAQLPVQPTIPTAQSVQAPTTQPIQAISVGRNASFDEHFKFPRDSPPSIAHSGSNGSVKSSESLISIPASPRPALARPRSHSLETFIKAYNDRLDEDEEQIDLYKMQIRILKAEKAAAILELQYTKHDLAQEHQ
jgi:hypothetical protein